MAIKTQTIALLMDCHHPDVEPGMWHAALLLLADVQPTEIILGGDFGEWSSGSRHIPDAFRTAFRSDVECIRTAIKQLRSACPKAKITYLEGNHETMVPRMLADRMPSLIEGFSLREELGLDDLGVDWVGEAQQPITRGRLRVLHGHQLPGRALPKHHAAKVADIYGAPGTVTVIGHSHRPQSHLRASYGGNADAYAIGAMRTLAPGWLRGQLAAWENELAIAYVRADGEASVYPVRYRRGLTWGGKTYR